MSMDDSYSYISDSGVVKKKDFLGICVMIFSNITIVALLVLGVLAVIF